jgi:1,4-alpha-glucan branching enzyme
MHVLSVFSLSDPHRYLGLHTDIDQSRIIRLWRPGNDEVHLEVHGKKVKAEKIDEAGLFECRVAAPLEALDYKVYHANGLFSYDPYAFSPTFGEIDAHLFSKGVHYKLYEVLGARRCEHQGVIGTKFAVWAPSASSVFLIGDFNFWNDRAYPMRSMGGCGVWELFIPGLEQGEKYKFCIITQEGTKKFKTDPFALSSELRPLNASIVSSVDSYKWSDQKWQEEKLRQDSLERPFLVYELHLGSWKGESGSFMNYRQIAPLLADYCKEMGFTHVELLPISEHPLDESWGYQVSGFYSVTSRYGSPEDFQYFVDYLHGQGIGVLLDWVVAHFPMDDFSLAQFDGTSLYEHQDPRKGYHPHWNTCIFNYGRFEVSNFLISNALFWFDKMHIDGLRVDAVASMIYLDYGREEGAWIPNEYGGRENLEALEFLKHLNSIVHEKFPKALMIAEESTAFMGVTHSLQWNGLGFDLKWNMGWMNDTLRYFKTDPIFRCYHSNDLTFGILYIFSERFMLALSHDEVVHGKASLLSKMPGDLWQKFAHLRLLYSYMICQPGKKLFFMGGEIGQWDEWNCKQPLQWNLLDYPLHQGVQRSIREINHFYQQHPSFWEFDFDSRGFEWVDFSDRQNCVISYLRKGKKDLLLCVHNFTPAYFDAYRLPLRNVKKMTEVFSTDREEYGGSGKLNPSISIQKDQGVSFCLAPLATMIFEVEFDA